MSEKLHEMIESKAELNQRITNLQNELNFYKAKELSLNPRLIFTSSPIDKRPQYEAFAPKNQIQMSSNHFNLQ